ncbi:MAG: hypothetical protein J0L84_18360 [Verrucomicrobia bacterium]|nr:hypothetical protein [Verrucomicrobiota bacterium]
MNRHLLTPPASLPQSVTAALMCMIALLWVRGDTFGTGANSFTMDFVTIGNPGNEPRGGEGGVDYVFRMGTYEVSREMVVKADVAGDLGFALSYGASAKPALLTWNEAARFVNWLNTSSGYSPAYKFDANPGDPGYSTQAQISAWDVGDAGYNAANPYRNSEAHYVLPALNEWIKAGFYDPATGRYFRYPTGSDETPTSVTGGTAPGTAVFNPELDFTIPGPADISNAGGLSPYGTMAQGGNEWEFLETVIPGDEWDPDGRREIRGGAWRGYSGLGGYLANGSSPVFDPSEELAGFRVVAIPEPTAWPLAALAPVGLWLWRRRCRWA